MQDYSSFPPLEIIGAKGSNLHLKGGNHIIDAVSSWWCKSLGHGHPRLKQALLQQSEKFEHVLLANTTNQTIEELSARLAKLSPGLDKVFYASDGSMAVEIAVKMSLQAQKQRGQIQRTKFMALENGYHGESLMALSLSDLGLYKNPYAELLTEVFFLKGIPYVTSPADPLWTDCSLFWPALEKQLDVQKENLCAIVIEPLLQGAGGMLIYSADFLRRLRKWTKAHHVYLIADEILTGLGRTGKALACEHAGIQPDFICLSKSLTAGWLPLSAVLTSTLTYNLFYGDYTSGTAFLHSNTFAGNALAAAVALETLKIYTEENLFAQVEGNQSFLHSQMELVGSATGHLKNIRYLGALVAADLAVPGEKAQARIGYQVYQAAIRRGALLRPLGNTIYWLLPLNVESNVIEKLRDITIAAIQEVLG